MEKDWVIAYTSDQQYLVEIARQVLEDNGIEAVIMNKRDTSYQTFGYIELYVRGGDLIRAKNLIKSI